MTPRNLRKPTPRRVAGWWKDWCFTWGTIENSIANEAWWERRVEECQERER